MIANRSVPVNTVLPHIYYRDVEKAVAWLTNAFGFIEHYRYGNPISGAQLKAQNAWIMVTTLREHGKAPKDLGFGTQSLTIFVENVEEHYARARSAGVKLLEELHETVYGELQYAAEDLDGHKWLFSRHARDVSPDQWGAAASNAQAAAVSVDCN